jgi:hypothetical protein
MGNNVQIPAPVWNVAPNPVPEAPPVVAAVIPAEPPEVAGQWGEPQWMKSFKTEIEHEVELEDLLSDDPHVPREVAETEIEWFLLQADPDGVFEVENEAEMGDGNKSVIRRYEFYEYTGPRNPEDNEADPRPFVNGEPDPLDVGQYIGAQNAAVNVGGAAGPLALGPAALPFGELGITYSATVVSGGTTPYQFTVLKGAVPPGLSLNPATGALSGTPTEAKQTFRFTVEVTDQDGTSVTGVVKIHIMRPVDIATNALKTGKQDKTYKATVKAKLGVKPYSWALVAGTLPAGVTFNALTGVLSGTPTEGGTFEPVFQVTDTLGGQADRVLPITIKAVALPVLSSQ